MTLHEAAAEIKKLRTDVDDLKYACRDLLKRLEREKELVRLMKAGKIY